MSKWDRVPEKRRKEIFRFNAARAADASAAADMHVMAAAIGRLPRGLLKKILTDAICDILSRYGVDVSR